MSILNLEYKGKISGKGSPNYLDSVYNGELFTKNSTKYLVTVSYADNSLSAFNVSDPENIILVGNINGYGSPNYLDGACAIRIWNKSEIYYAVVVSYEDNSLSIFNINIPTSPTLVGTIHGAGTPNYLNGAFSLDICEISGIEYAFVASSKDNSLSIFNINTPASPTFVSRIYGTGTPNYLQEIHDVSIIEIDSKFYAVCTGYKDNSISVIEVTDPANPILKDFIQDNTSLLGSHSVTIKEIDSVVYAFVTAFYSNSVVVINITDPENISIVDTLIGNIHPQYINNPTKIKIVNMGSYACAIVASYSDDSLLSIDINDPEDIAYSYSLAGNEYPSYLDGIRGFCFDSSNLYVMAHDINSIVSFEISLLDEEPPVVGGYLWSNTSKIQALLSERSMIIISDIGNNNYPISNACVIENMCVRKIVNYLNTFFIISVDDSPTDYLIDLVSELTASTIGTAEMGASIGQDASDWTNVYKNNVWSSLQQCAVSNTLEGFHPRGLSLLQRLIYSKMRESSIVRIT